MSSMNKHATTEELFEAMFSTQSVSRLYGRDEQEKLLSWELAVTSSESSVTLLDATTKQ
jgi:hypothetical protein